MTDKEAKSHQTPDKQSEEQIGEKKRLYCTVCKTIFTTATEMKKHESSSEHIWASMPVPNCTICNISFSNEWEKKMHSISIEHVKASAADQHNQGYRQSRHNCFLCEKNIQSIPSWECHVRSKKHKHRVINCQRSRPTNVNSAKSSSSSSSNFSRNHHPGPNGSRSDTTHSSQTPPLAPRQGYSRDNNHQWPSHRRDDVSTSDDVSTFRSQSQGSSHSSTSSRNYSRSPREGPRMQAYPSEENMAASIEQTDQVLHHSIATMNRFREERMEATRRQQQFCQTRTQMQINDVNQRINSLNPVPDMRHNPNAGWSPRHQHPSNVWALDRHGYNAQPQFKVPHSEPFRFTRGTRRTDDWRRETHQPRHNESNWTRDTDRDRHGVTNNRSRSAESLSGRDRDGDRGRELDQNSKEGRPASNKSIPTSVKQHLRREAGRQSSSSAGSLDTETLRRIITPVNRGEKTNQTAGQGVQVAPGFETTAHVEKETTLPRSEPVPAASTPTIVSVKSEAYYASAVLRSQPDSLTATDSETVVSSLPTTSRTITSMDEVDTETATEAELVCTNISPVRKKRRTLESAGNQNGNASKNDISVIDVPEVGQSGAASGRSSATSSVSTTVSATPALQKMELAIANGAPSEEVSQMYTVLNLSVQEKNLDRQVSDRMETLHTLKAQAKEILTKCDAERRVIVGLKQQKKELRRQKVRILRDMSNQALMDIDEMEQANAPTTAGDTRAGTLGDRVSTDEGIATGESGVLEVEGRSCLSTARSQFGDDTVRQIIRRVINSERSQGISFEDLDTLMREFTTDLQQTGDLDVSASESDRRPPSVASNLSGESSETALSDLLSSARGPPVATVTPPVATVVPPVATVVPPDATVAPSLTTAPRQLEIKREAIRGGGSSSSRSRVDQDDSSDSDSSSSSSSSSDTPGPTRGASGQRAGRARSQICVKSERTSSSPAGGSGSKNRRHDSAASNSEIIDVDDGDSGGPPSKRPSLGATSWSSQPNLRTDALPEIFPGEISAHGKVPILDLAVHDGAVYTCSQDSTVKKFNLQTHECECIYRGHSAMVHCIYLTDSPKGVLRLFTGGFDNYLVVFNAKTGKELQRMVCEAKIHTLTSAWGLLYIGLGNGKVLTFDLAKNRTTGEFSASSRAISCMAAAKEGSRRVLIVGAQDRTLTVRDASSGLMLRSMDTAHRNTPVGVATLGHLLLSYADKALRVLDYTSGISLLSILVPVSVSSMCVNEKFLCVGGVDGSIRVYHVKRNLPQTKATRVYFTTKRVAVMGLHCTDSMIIAGNKEGDICILPMTSENFLCQFGRCTSSFGSRADLVYHVARDHVLSANSDQVACEWKDCTYRYATLQGIKTIEEHIEEHMVHIA